MGRTVDSDIEMKLLLTLSLCTIYLLKDTVSSCVEDVDCLTTKKGLSYKGTETKTVSGRTCQNWSSETPHKPRFGQNLTGNYCRNPVDADGPTPWCYTTDPAKRWDYCGIHLCERCKRGSSCIVNADCLASKDGVSYQGTLNKTVSGRTCKPWSQTQYANSNLDGNYCRNPDGDSTIWCYTTDPGVCWEFCHVELCSDCNSGITPDCRCGLVQRSQRIIGGLEAEVNEYPWMVSLLLRGTHACGGSLINSRWILSAGHCFQRNSDPKLWQAALGEHDRTIDTEADHIEMDILRIVNHPSYQGFWTHVDFDFSLLQMTLEVDFSIHPHIRPICLPANDDNTYENMVATATGWGRIVAGGQSPSKLQELDVNVLSNQECVDDYAHTSDQISEQMVCAIRKGVKGVCHGDSGGPLIVPSSGGANFVLIGVVSWGYPGCAHDNYPAVYARVSKQLDWISETVVGNKSKTCPR